MSEECISGVHAFVNVISLKVNVIAQPEIELAYYDVAVQHFSNYTTETAPIILSNVFTHICVCVCVCVCASKPN